MPYGNQVSEFYGWYLRHNARTTWRYMSDAGIDVFASGPSNNPQSFLDLTNVLPSINGGLNRRWGVNTFSALTSGSPFVTPVRVFPYSFPQDSSNVANTANTNVWITSDGLQNFETYTDNGTVFSGFGPSNFANAGTVEGTTSRGYFYYGNQVNPPRKVNPSYTTASTDWLVGIKYPGFGSGSTNLPDYPAALTSDFGAYNFLGSAGTCYPQSTGYGYLSAPSVTIVDPTGAGSGASISLQIGVHGEVISYTLTSGGTGYKEATATVAAPPSGGVQAQLVLYVQTNPSAPNSGQVVGADFGGPLVFASGRQYTVALQNSITGHTSDVYITNLPRTSKSGTFLDNLTSQYNSVALNAATNPPVFVSGAGLVGGFTQNELIISVPASSLDPQVDTVILLATVDGGTPSTLYEVTKIPLSSFTLVSGYYQFFYVDTLPDSIDNASTVISGLASSGTVQASQFATNLSFNGTEWQFNSSGGGQMRTIGGANPTDPLIATGFGINVPPGATITGVEVSLFWNGQNNGTGTMTQAQLYHSGVGIGTAKTPGIVNTVAPLTTVLGGSSDLWGATLTPAIVNDPTFGWDFELTRTTVGGTDRSFAYTWTMTVFYTGTAGTGTTLLGQNLYAFTDEFGNEFGILNNTPPTATGFGYPTTHQGRMFTTDGKTVFYSKSIEEVTTPTGLITSKWEECWPGDFILPIALENEQIIGLKSDGTNLHVGTTKSIFTVFGSGPTDFSVPSVAFAQTGILNHDAWSVIYSEGQPAGFVWLTQDLKIVYSDFATYQDIGTPIYPKLGALDPTKIANCKVSSLTQGPYNFVILTLFFQGTGLQQPEFWIWETRLKKWYRWVLPAGEVVTGPPTTTVGTSFVYQYPTFTTLPSGITAGDKFLFYTWNYADATPSYKFAVRRFDPLATQDTTTSTTNIPWSVQTSWQDLGDNTSIKVANEVEVTSDESAITVSLYGANSQAQFDSGGTLLKTGPTITGPISSLASMKFYCAGAATAAKYYSLAFSPVSAGTSPSVLSSFSIETYPIARI